MVIDLQVIKNAIKLKGYTQKELAQKIGMSETALSQALKTGGFKLENLKKLADALDVSICEFFGEEKTERQGNNQIIMNGGSVRSKNIQIQQTIEHSKELEKENEILREKVKSLEDQLRVYREMIEILKNQTKN